MPKRLLAIFVLLSSLFVCAQTTSKPKVRAITAFVNITPSGYRAELKKVRDSLAEIQKDYESAGYQVQSVRITTQPFPAYVKGMSRPDALKFLQELDALSIQGNYAFNIGPAMMSDAQDPAMMELLAETLSSTKNLVASAHIANQQGIQWKVIAATSRMLKHVSAHSPNGVGNFNFNATAMLAPYTPFYNGSYHLGSDLNDRSAGGAGVKFAVGLESANVVQEVMQANAGDHAGASAALRRELGRHAQDAETVAQRAAKQVGWEYLGIDPTPAPLKDVSIGAAIESFTRNPLGSSGTLTAAWLITEAVRSLPVKHIGYSGLMLPVLEDGRIAQRWSEGRVTLDALLSYSSVCATGLDTVPLPGDISEEQLTRILGDVAALAVKWNKPLTARLLPAPGKKSGDMTEFDNPFLVNAKIQP
ncbi:MAG TPA: DUF711 family protein [Terriglobales bacterium]|jgi:uncharacterized protein (UPF0210 family)|nr:DUF711 family protein [Terriglobales bacterium]